MTTPSIVTLGPADLPAAAGLNALIHGDDVDWLAFLTRHPAWAPPGTHRARVVGGEMVALTSVARWRQRFGSSTLPVGEIGLVGTHPDHRHQGHASALMADWLATLRAEGVPLAFLFGIPDFYDQWDFAYAAPNSSPARLHMPLAALDAIPAAVGRHLRPLDPVADLAAVQALEAAASAVTPCSPLRDAALWTYAFAEDASAGREWLLVVDDSGAPTGFARFHPEGAGGMFPTPGALSWGAASDVETARAIAAEVLRRLRARGETSAGLAIAPWQWLGRWFHAHGARLVTDNRIVPGVWAGMYRVLDLAAVLTAWAPEHAAALATAAPFSPLALTLRAAGDAVATLAVEGHILAIHPGAGGLEVGAPVATVVPWLTGWRGFDDPWAFAAEPWRDALPAEAARLLRTLFPIRHPWLGDLWE